MRDGILRRRRWVSLTIALLVSLAGPAGTALADHAQPDHRREEIWHVRHTVEASVVDNYATVRVGVEIANEGPDPEFPFRVRVPDDAYVTGLTITRDGTTYEAQVLPADEARDRYEEARSEGRSAGLVEETRDSSVYQYNVNVEGRETVRAVLTYEAYLDADGGAYELPLHAPATQRGVDEGARFNVTVESGSGLGDVDARPDGRVRMDGQRAHVEREVGPRGQDHDTRLDVRYEVEETPPGGRLVTIERNGTGYFAHRLRADANRTQVPVDVALVLDKSGSMRGEKIDQLERATRRLVDELDEDDRLHLTFFADGARGPWEGFRRVDANATEDALDALDRVRATGSTNVEAAIREGFAPFEDRSADGERLPVIVFLTDGRATTGVQDTDALRERALEANGAGAHVFSLAFGDDADWSLVHGLAEDGRGLARRVAAGPGAELDLSGFLTSLTTPVLTDVSVAYEPSSVEAHRVGAPVLFAGGELLYVGTYDPETVDNLTATVEARERGQARSWTTSEPAGTRGPAGLADLVAYQRIQDLEARIDARGPNETLVERATELALDHGFVTERTSLEVDLPEQHRSQPEPVAADGAEDTHAVSRDASDGAHRSTAADRGGAPAEDTGAAEAPGPGLLAGLAALGLAALALRRRG